MKWILEFGGGKKNRVKSRNKTVPSGEGVEDNSTEWGRRRAGGLRGGSRKLRYVGQISTPSLLTNALGRPAVWAGPRGYSNIQSEEETEAATAAGGAATKRGGSGGANNPLPHPALVPWEDAGWGRVARECARAHACVRACVPSSKPRAAHLQAVTRQKGACRSYITHKDQGLCAGGEWERRARRLERLRTAVAGSRVD